MSYAKAATCVGALAALLLSDINGYTANAETRECVLGSPEQQQEARIGELNDKGRLDS